VRVCVAYLYEYLYVVSRRYDKHAFDSVLARLDGTERQMLGRGASTVWESLGRNVLYRWLFIATVTHGIWTSAYGVLLTESVPSCLQDACAHEREALFADEPPYEGAGGNSSCLVIQPLNGELGSCADPGQPGHIGPVLMSAGVTAVRIAGGSRCRLRCAVKEGGEPYRASGSSEVVCGAGGQWESPEYCVLDQLRLLDFDGESSFLRCIDWKCPTAKEQQLYAWVLVLGGSFLVILGLDWLMKENVFAMFAFLFSSTIISFRALYVPLSQLKELDNKLLPTVNAAVNSVFSMYYYYVAYSVRNDFGTYIFKVTKTSVNLRSVFRIHSIFMTVLKIDIMVAILVTIVGFIFFFDDSNERAAAICGIVLVFAVGILAHEGTRSESKLSMLVFFLCSLPAPVYVTYKMQQVLHSKGSLAADHHGIWKPAVAVVGCLTLVVRSTLLVYGIRVYRSFGRGLKARRRQARQLRKEISDEEYAQQRNAVSALPTTPPDDEGKQRDRGMEEDHPPPAPPVPGREDTGDGVEAGHLAALAAVTDSGHTSSHGIGLTAHPGLDANGDGVLSPDELLAGLQTASRASLLSAPDPAGTTVESGQSGQRGGEDPPLPPAPSVPTLPTPSKSSHHQHHHGGSPSPRASVRDALAVESSAPQHNSEEDWSPLVRD
jgi:ABC-type multidrug transport system fused ATPase/permease subunit